MRETGHEARLGDIDLLASLGIGASRYPVLWEKAIRPGSRDFDFGWAAARLERLRTLGIDPVVTLLHHGSGPDDTSLVDSEFPDRFAAYAAAAAAAFPWVERWTPINEPLTTARFSTLYGHWYPQARSDRQFGIAIVNEALAMLLAIAAIRRENPYARFTITEDLQGFVARDPGAIAYVAHKRERSFLSIELVMGRIVAGHPMHAYLTRECHVPVATLDRIVSLATVPDLIGWNYYPNSERALTSMEDGSFRNEPARHFAAISPRPLLRAAHARLGLPFGLSEVHVNADEVGRVAWFDARLDDLTTLAREGLPVKMIGAWAAFGLVDWDSLLTRRENIREDGVFTLSAPSTRPSETRVSRRVRAVAAQAVRPVLR